MITIGVTGSIGVGKSTVANMIRDLGIPVHDADAAVAKFLSAEGDAVKMVAEEFPTTLKKDASGKEFIDKHELGKIVFNNKEKKQILENILHPMVITDSNLFIKEMEKLGHSITAFEIPLLFETNRDKDLDVTICVSCSPENQKMRILQRPRMTEEKFNSIIKEQMPDAEKRNRADYVILNDGDVLETKKNLEETIENIKSKFAIKGEN